MELRRLVLTDELLTLPDQIAQLRQETTQGFQQLASQIAVLTAAQARTEERLTALSEAQVRADERLTASQAHTDEQFALLAQAQARTEERLTALSTAHAQTADNVRWLKNWQRGANGRREGERYERDIGRRAPALFHGGEGGPTDRSDVQQRLARQLEAVLARTEIEAEDDPFLADVIWWKAGQIVVVEVSVQVDRQDVNRAERRAATLRKSGVAVQALVIGEQWATPDAREQAQTHQVEWKVGSDLSDGFLTFCRQ